LASRLLAEHRDNRVCPDSKVDPDKAESDKAAPAQAQVDRASPSSSAGLAALRGNRVFPDSKVFLSKAVRDRKACRVNRARPINLATEAPALVRKARE
jgi:hypothetical protein